MLSGFGTVLRRRTVTSLRSAARTPHIVVQARLALPPQETGDDLLDCLANVGIPAIDVALIQRLTPESGRAFGWPHHPAHQLRDRPLRPVLSSITSR